MRICILQQNICCRMEQIYDIEERVSETLYCNLSNVLTKVSRARNRVQRIKNRTWEKEHGRRNNHN